jgi:hypothetical protein
MILLFNEKEPHMSDRQPRYDKEEYARRGMEMYEKVVRPQVGKPENRGRLVAVDIETGDFELDDGSGLHSRRLLARSPDAQILEMRIGYKAARRFGNAVVPEDPL